MSKPYTKQNLEAFFAGVRAGYDAAVKANVKAQAERTASDKAVKELNQKLGHIKHCLGIK
jgi:hypothetical protein